MPLFELEASPRGRMRVFVRAQLPFLLGAAFVGLVAAIAVPEKAMSGYMPAAYVLVALASLAAVLVPWERFDRTWLITVALTDIVAVAFIRTELISVIASAGLLAMFPVLWLAYGFRPWTILVAVAGAAFISSFPFFTRGEWPATALEWANVVTLPAIIVGVALMANLAARQLRRNRDRVAEAHAEQTAALLQAEDNAILMRSILNTVNTAVAFYGPSNELALSNKIASTMTEIVGFRLDRPPYAGDNVLAMDRMTPIPYEGQIIPRALRGEILTDHMEWLGPPDQQVAILASSRRVTRDDGALLGTVVVAYDVTELATAVEVREEFLRTVSHELRTPLTNITGYLELIEDGLDESETQSRAYIAVIQRNAQVLLDRIRELLAATDTSEPLRLEPTDLRALVDLAIVDAGDRAGAKSIAIEHLDTGPASAMVDSSRLRQAVTELLVNAAKFSPEHSVITVEQGMTAENAFIRVSDQGPGIGRADETRVFDRFYRTAFARENAVQGFGIGLTMVKSTIVAHHGRIHLVPSDDAGTTFTLELPREGPDPSTGA
ncbi:sensor histidine kinase [Microbacterium sp. P07]|uniref:sensor histidine kinase n=1 Tax=Microbacterium sp. P07 TaxID=3366952 RepID=UPI0037454AEE